MHTKTLTLLGAIALLAAASADAQLANISTRGKIGVQQELLIGGFILDQPATVVIRALGPTLQSFGVTDWIPDPILVLYNENSDPVSFNDDWGNDQRASELGALAPSNALESALVVTLPAGRYTVVVGGHNACTGIGLVEIYLKH